MTAERMSRRDRQLYANADNVHQLVDFIMCKDRIAKLDDGRLVLSQSHAQSTLIALAERWTSNTACLSDDDCATQFNAWAASSLTRPGWRDIKNAYTRVKSRTKLGREPVYLTAEVKARLGMMRDVMGFESLDALVDYLLADKEAVVYRHQDKK